MEKVVFTKIMQEFCTECNRLKLHQCGNVLSNGQVIAEVSECIACGKATRREKCFSNTVPVVKA